MHQVLTISDVEKYLDTAKSVIKENRYRIERNRNRTENIKLFQTYLVDEALVKEVLLSLTPYDFCEATPNRHKGFEREILYIFGKCVTLVERFSECEKQVPLYIKLNLLEDELLIVISFHEQQYPLHYYFSENTEERSSQGE